MLVWFYLGWCYVLAKTQQKEMPPTRRPVCPDCGGELHLVAITDHLGRAVYRAAAPGRAAVLILDSS